MTGNVLKSATDTGVRVMQGFASSKEAVAEALQDGQKTVKRFIKRTRNTTEDLLDDAAQSIKRFPIGSVAVAFGVGAVLGVLISRTGRR
jgi:ElaB/YqjD/DUF883 family membrane-anchored ribosome-binding protein